jgi:hypothetical protein
MKFTPELLAPLRSDPDRLITMVCQQAEGLLALQREHQGLQAEHAAVRGQLEALLEDLRLKNARVVELEGQLAGAQAQAARQAAPFRRPDKAKSRCPGKPGRKKGHRGSRRSVPATIHHHQEVPLPQCPRCRGPVTDPQRVEQYIEELPPVQPVVTHLTTWRAWCSKCDCEVCSTHPLQVSSAVGAAGVFLGPRALALICDLNKAKGLSVRKTCAVLHEHFGLRLSPGGLTQAVARVAAKQAGDYDQLVKDLRAASVVHADETSWWVGGPGWWLWDFTNHQTTAYVVVNNRARATVTATLGADFAGVLVSDCLAIYDEVNPLQQKCYSHHFRAIQQAAERHPQQASPWLDSIRLLLRTAMILSPLRASSDPVTWALILVGLQRRAAELLSPARTEPAEESVRNRLQKQQDHLFEFLKHDGVDPTNNLAERQLRPAVIARKISCGNKTQKGARAFVILASLAATARQRGKSFVTDLTAALSKGQPSG